MSNTMTIKGLRIDIGADTSNLTKALKTANATIRTTQSSLRDVEKALRFDPGNSDLVRDKQKLLADQVSDTKAQIKALEAEQKAFDTAGIDKNSQAYKALQTEIDIAKSKLLSYQDAQRGTKAEIADTNDALAQTQKHLKGVDSALQINPTSITLLKEKEKLLGDQVNDTKQKLVLLKREQSEMRADGVEKSSLAYKDLQAQIVETSAQLEQLEKSQQKFGSASGQQLSAVGTDIEAAGEKISSVGAKMSAVTTVPIIGGMAAATQSSMDFETALAKLSTIADTAQTPIRDLKKQIMSLSEETGVSSTDIANATYDAISAGQSTSNAVGFVKNAIKLSKAGFTDTSTSLDVLTTTLNAYGMSSEKAEDIANKLIVTQNLGKTTVDQLGQSIGKVIPTANSFGVSFDQIASSLVSTTKNGIQTAESVTYVNSMLNELGKSGTTASTILADNYGVTFKQLMDAGYSLTDVLSMIQQYADDTGISIADCFGSQEAGKAAATLVQHANDFTTAMQQMSQSAGTLQTAYDKVDGTNAAQMEKTMNLLHEDLIAIGDTVLTTFGPALHEVATEVKDITLAFQSLPESTKTAIVQFAAVVAAMGPVIVVAGKLVTGFGALVKGTGSLVNGIVSVGTAFASLHPTAALVFGIISLLIGAGIELYENWDAVAAAANDMKNAVSNAWSGMVQGIKTPLESMLGLILDAWDWVSDKFGSAGSGILGFLDSIGDGIYRKITGIGGTLKAWFTGIIKSIKDMIKLPHFKLHGGFSLNPLSVPTVSVDWYAKAMQSGMILNNPTIFGAQNGRLLGAGEAGSETVVGTKSLMSMIQNAVGQQTPNVTITLNVAQMPGQDSVALAQTVADILSDRIRKTGAVWA